MRSFHLSDKFLKDAKETENKIEKTDSFVPFAHYEGKEQIIDPSLYDEEKYLERKCARGDDTGAHFLSFGN